MNIRKELSEKRYLDTFFHSLVIILFCIVFSFVFPQIPKTTLIAVLFVGGFVPDVDHLVLYKMGKFKSFREFLNWSLHTNRYRVGLEMFHNFPTVLFLIFVLPILFFKSKIMFHFFFSFLFHLLVDIAIDKIVLKNLNQWRFTSKL